jgi:hypothetical protein
VKKKLVNLIILILFTSTWGCLNYIQDVQIYPDGSGKMTIHYWMNAPDTENFQILDRVGIFNPDSIRSQFSSEYSTIEDVEVYTDTTDSTVHGIVKFSFIHIDSLNNTKAFADADFLLRDGASGQKIFSQFVPPLATGFGIDGNDFSITYKYTFSGEIITHNAPEQEGRTLVWNYSLPEIGKGKTISVTFRPFKLKETPYWIYIISGVVLLIVIIFLFRKKKD